MDPHMRFPPERPHNAAYPGVRVRKKGLAKIVCFEAWVWKVDVVSASAIIESV